MATLIFDLDGVIWRGTILINRKIPAIIEKFRRNRHKIYFLTNNSTRSQSGYQKKLEKLGIKSKRSEIICSANAIRMYLEKRIKKDFGNPGFKPKIFVIGTLPLKKEIKKVPAKILKLNDKDKADYVVVGMDWHFTYKKMRRASSELINGAKFIATNADKTFPEKNTISPGCGSLLAAISTASGKKPYIIGKPNPEIIRIVLGKKSLKNEKTYFIGDRLDTDIIFANRMGFIPVMVLSGATTQKMAREAKGLHKPEYIIKDVTGMRKIIKNI
ncbi:hydrolase [Candidatus Desantisbacteria bacterium CG07_land_8_20_14_0_80_39_15]|nr:MAG: hydrolase [Candidatus Desantisbacteria bacterium CG07_land_8_20_14_0_80_39_15]PIZ16259.1 MAG: hydrolase [Candidatus Desantisbacteria bacterium CG_4_10_14_0_8_um_filter_39_17]